MINRVIVIIRWRQKIFLFFILLQMVLDKYQRMKSRITLICGFYAIRQQE